MIISGKELSSRLKTDMRDEVSTFPEKYGRVHLSQKQEVKHLKNRK